MTHSEPPDLQQAKPARSLAMFENMADGRGCKDGDSECVISQLLNDLRYAPIGFFDSGIGGLTVFRELSRTLPHENLIYFGDTARLPYGTKSPSTVSSFTLECVEWLLKQQIKLLIVACHTASAHALPLLRQKLSIPVLGVIEPGVELLLHTTASSEVAILATSGTIHSKAYEERLVRLNPKLKVHSIACPLFVSLVEENLIDHPATYEIASHYLASLKKTKTDTALLACTHFPLLRTVIQNTLGPKVQVIESTHRCVRMAVQQLQALRLLNPSQSAPVYQFFSTDNPQRFSRLAEQVLGYQTLCQSPIDLEEKQTICNIC